MQPDEQLVRHPEGQYPLPRPTLERAALAKSKPLLAALHGQSGDQVFLGEKCW